MGPKVGTTTTVHVREGRNEGKRKEKGRNDTRDGRLPWELDPDRARRATRRSLGPSLLGYRSFPVCTDNTRGLTLLALDPNHEIGSGMATSSPPHRQIFLSLFFSSFSRFPPPIASSVVFRPFLPLPPELTANRVFFGAVFPYFFLQNLSLLHLFFSPSPLHLHLLLLHLLSLSVSSYHRLSSSLHLPISLSLPSVIFIFFLDHSPHSSGRSRPSFRCSLSETPPPPPPSWLPI